MRYFETRALLTRLGAEQAIQAQNLAQLAQLSDAAAYGGQLRGRQGCLIQSCQRHHVGKEIADLPVQILGFCQHLGHHPRRQQAGFAALFQDLDQIVEQLA